MDLSSTDELVTTSDSTSNTTPQASNPPAASSLPLRRLGSCTSGLTEVDLTGSAEAESCKKLPSSKYKGVVPQPNGRWGAQIYEKHQRVWLGTFNEESEAARAYDTAALRFRGRDAVTNFKIPESDNEESRAEAMFLNSHSKAEIVDMLRKHTYKDELEQSIKKRLYTCSSSNKGGFCLGLTFLVGDKAVARAREHLFQKAVTPSDVGKLNRLVIPKQYAEKHFPLQSGSQAASKGLLLNFEDRSGKVWRFRYSYWNSSQSYVLTKGWSRFVKEKNLRAGDVVSFYRSTNQDNKQLYIDWKVRKSNGGGGGVKTSPVVRLFGVNISEVPINDVSSQCNGKRLREIGTLESFGSCNKKQRMINVL